MDSTSSAAATLTRPRFAIQVVTGLAAAFILYQAWQQPSQPSSSSSPDDSSGATTATAAAPSGNALHRSNAVRRTERSTRRQLEGALQDIENQFGPDQRQQLESILEAHFNRHDGPPPTTPNPGPLDLDLDDPRPDESANMQNPQRPLRADRADRDAETVALEDPSVHSDWDGDNWLMPPPRSGHNIVGLLFRVSEDNARRNAYVHRGCMCNACGLLPIRGIRYRCANCADFDLCETCESQGLHHKTHVFYKVRVPAPPFGPKSMQPVWYPGDPDNSLRTLPSPLIKHLARETGFERPELEALWEQWTFIANTEWRDDPDELYLAADRMTFERYLVPASGTKRTAPNLIHDRMFAFYDTNGDDLISFPEFLKGLSYKKGKERLERIFKGFDIDGDGYISRRDCLRIFRTYYVLYKHMHGDVLEGLDQQALHNTETHQLVTGRQPLSSHFGREGRVPEADHGRPMEGKAFHSNGDVYITDDKSGVVNENRPDVGDRENVLSSLFNHRGDSDYGGRYYSPPSEHVTSPAGIELSRIHQEALLNPPTRVEDLPSLLVGESRNVQPGDSTPENREEQQNGQDSGSEEDTSVEDEDEDAQRPDGEGAMANGGAFTSLRYTITADGITNVRRSTTPPRSWGGSTDYPPAVVLREAGDERWTNRPPTESQLRAQHLRIEAHRKRVMDRNLRDQVRKKLFDRWKKRSFYLVEEEGDAPPAGFDEEDDVLGDMAGTEGFDSNVGQPPLSARSRSSSKVRFAEDTDDYEIRSNPSTSSRSVPERWGGMDIPDAERDMGKEILYVVTQQAFNELLDVLFKEKEDLAVQAAQSREWRDAYRDVLDLFDPDAPSRPPQPGKENEYVSPAQGDENKPARQRDVRELLATSGYTIDGNLSGNVDHITDDEEETSQEEQSSDESSEDDSEVEQEDVPHRDPTMPQFRPNSAADLLAPAKSAKAAAKPKGLSNGGAAPNGRKRTGSPSSSTPPKERPLTRPPRATLVDWKKLDAAETEARERGGWGRLTLAEFKDVWRREENGPHRLDYLGTWIDFCIP